jgi:hypothetical protein
MWRARGLTGGRPCGSATKRETPRGDGVGRSGQTLVVRNWRAEQLRRLGVPSILAETFADAVDWHALSALIERGCPLGLALEIVR